MSLAPTGKGHKHWSQRWKAALNALEITFEGRLAAALPGSAAPSRGWPRTAGQRLETGAVIAAG